ncbi:hypothetical protein [Psychroserpens sp. S379A]|uniref:hypothetical protein n=1 Tax=Psychroserpens sp. S379A TaxID=3415137 RepID=UPI003C7E947B
MKNFKQHIISKITTSLVVICLVAPIGVKFTHLFSNHEHEVCLGENQSHFHEIDTDCEFFKFKINHNSFITISNYDLKQDFEPSVLEIEYYSYLKSQQQITSYLRGPPYLV